MLLSLNPRYNYAYIIYPLFNLTKAMHTYVLIIYEQIEAVIPNVW